MNNDHFIKHNQRVIHVLERLLGVVEYKAAAHWLVWANQSLGMRKPIDMIDDDYQYEQLLRAVEILEMGEPF